MHQWCPWENAVRPPPAPGSTSTGSVIGTSLPGALLPMWTSLRTTARFRLAVTMSNGLPPPASVVRAVGGVFAGARVLELVGLPDPLLGLRDADVAGELELGAHGRPVIH